MISYEASKWYIKVWRTRWYVYAIFLHLISFIDVKLWLDIILYQQLDDDDNKKLRSNWKEIKHHVELSKMYKFSSKTNYERED